MICLDVLFNFVDNLVDNLVDALLILLPCLCVAVIYELYIYSIGRELEFLFFNGYVYRYVFREVEIQIGEIGEFLNMFNRGENTGNCRKLYVDI